MPDFGGEDGEPVIFVGDTVKLKTGQVATVVEVWGVARTWYKLQTQENAIIFKMTDDIESIVKRFSKKRSCGFK